ncbi:polyphenol oxidase family protein [uncultured Enorma sp.]|uniref:polyphenol oxidase family protein n=1 Tax=uncultured Enorma sp. TaxID=1714346 RepID=UPI0025E80A8B|nr:polyphenol oxidase family protein [uncultured Enorma sp.]
MKRLVRIERSGVHIVGCVEGTIAFGFTERTGGVSTPPFASLNLGAHVGDDPQAVAENRRRVLRAVGASSRAENLLVPNQVHSDHVAVVRSSDPSVLEAARAEIADGSDAIVCTAPDVPVMLCFADCVPVILTAPGGFAVVHSGWKGTYAGIAGTAARVLAREASCAPGELCAYIGPHILGDEYEVSPELIDRFDARFEDAHPSGSRLLDLSRCIVQSLVEAGVPEASVADTGLSTIRQNDRFFSYRAEAGTCGRHAAVAIMRSFMNGGA